MAPMSTFDARATGKSCQRRVGLAAGEGRVDLAPERTAPKDRAFNTAAWAAL